MRLKDCHNIDDFRRLAKARLPFPVFHYIDGAADDELTRRRNRDAFDSCDLVPDVLMGNSEVDMSTVVLGRKIAMPLFLSPTALQRLFHWQGERAVARSAEKFGTYFGISSLATVSIEEIGSLISTPKMFQLYVHKDKGLNRSMIDRCKAAKFDALTLTVDTIVGGNRERCLRTGFSSPPKLTPASAVSFALHPRWTLDYLLREKFALPNLDTHVKEGSNVAMSVADYFNTMLDPTLDWKRPSAEIDGLQERSPPPASFDATLTRTVPAVAPDAAPDIGATAIMVSNHGGRQLDGSRAPFDQLAEICDAVGDKLDVICDGGITRGTHVLKALSVGAKACSGGRLYLYALAAAGQPGVERAIGKLRDEIERDMKLMGVKNVSELNRDNLRWR